MTLSPTLVQTTLVEPPARSLWSSLTLIVLAWRERLRPRLRDERGLSQSTENAILLAGAATIAFGIIAFLKVYVADHMPKDFD